MSHFGRDANDRESQTKARPLEARLPLFPNSCLGGTPSFLLIITPITSLWDRMQTRACLHIFLFTVFFWVGEFFIQQVKTP